ncbi:hypothetical protein ACWD3J_46865 [Streptomyces sp. NPDC002755]|uniref:hypothetical protein n=1 Tax=Streptomyces sp. NPDC002884 TaxID=3154544 RepID=UPI003323E841
MANLDDRQQRRGGRVSDLLRRRSGGSGDVGESFQHLVEGDLAVVDGGAFVVGEWDAAELECVMSASRP